MKKRFAVTIKYLLGLLVLLVVADGLLTQLLIKGGKAREANPFLQPIVGEDIFIVLKVAGALLCGLILWDIYKRHPRVAMISTSCFVVFYGMIVLWNLSLALW
ncbi:DUF5658 family protein [Chloroflexota bacterium]